MDDLKHLKLTSTIKKILSGMKDTYRIVLIERQGLRGKPPLTLNAIGEKLGLTRERIRQIEKRAFEKLVEQGVIKKELPLLYKELTKLFQKYGGLVAESVIVRELGNKILENEEPLFTHNIRFILRGSGFIKVKKTLLLKPSWTNMVNFNVDIIEEAIKNLTRILNASKKPLEETELIKSFKKTTFYQRKKAYFTRELLKGILVSAAPLLKVEDTEKWGLVSWPEINPRTIHDWTYYTVKKHGKPIHFTKIAELIKQYQPGRKFNQKTIHNVLISDPRFVLVGNGIYALREWGYKPGTVYDVIVRILKKAQRPLTVSEIAAQVFKERIIKYNTILVNLQRKDTFEKVAPATYRLIPSKKS